MASSKEYDFVVFGATGFTGRYVAEELYRIQTEGKQKFTWAAAGRTEAKVRGTLTELDIHDVDVILADINDQRSIESMCGRARVVIDVVGPYVLYGEPVIEACINQRCDYVDITGESYYIESMIQKYGEAAKEAGVYIVNCCGFDSVPNDIGCLLLHKSFNGELAYIESYMKTNASGFNTGTWESAIRSMRSYKALNELRKAHRKPLPDLPDALPPRRRVIFYSDVVHSWCVPFMGTDKYCILQTAQYNHETKGTSMFRANPYFVTGSFIKTLFMVMTMAILVPLAITNWGLNLLLKYPGIFSAGMARKGGPTRDDIEKGTFSLTIDGAGFSSENTDKTKPDAFLRVKVKGAEPGYVATSAIMVQCAFCLINERGDLPAEGGIYTPGAAFGNTNIIHNIEKTGKTKFTIEQLNNN